MGIPFYGYLYSSVNNYNNGLYQPYFGANIISYGEVSSYYINYPGFTRFFHPESKVPWLFNGSIFISYDDPESIRYKAGYIKSYGLVVLDLKVAEFSDQKQDRKHGGREVRNRTRHPDAVELEEERQDQNQGDQEQYLSRQT